MKTILSVLVGIVIVAAIVVAIAAGRSNKTNTPSKTNSSTTQSTNTTNNTSSNNNQTPASSTNQVSISNFAFSPATITVKKGTIVTWTNNDSVAHTVTADSGNGPASDQLSPGKTYSFTFNTVGTINYHCSIHPEMHGTVTVTE